MNDPTVPHHTPNTATQPAALSQSGRAGAATAQAAVKSTVPQAGRHRNEPSGRDARPQYLTRYRRLLLDMHIADWDPAFLANYDPVAMADLYEQANANAVMMYCQSHVGLCYWPTQTGKMHPGIHGRDIVHDLLTELRRRDISACAYYSLIFNNWAFLEHPEWRMDFGEGYLHDVYAASRYGLCCPNNPGYREFAMQQAREIIDAYPFDAFFFDMTFWPGICLCSHCNARFKAEADAPIPALVDWTDPAWCRFQRAREEWIDEFAGLMSQCVKQRRPQWPVYHNFAIATCGWTYITPLRSARHHDFLGADFYGDAAEQLVVTKLMTHLSENRPIEFMTSQCTDLKDHVQLKSSEQLELQAFAATLYSAAILFIDAIDPAGTVNEAVYARTRDIYLKTGRYEPWLGGDPVEDFAVYFSNESKLNFAESGAAIGDRRNVDKDFAHRQALQGACVALQQAHLPFGVLTRKNLADLDRYKVLVLPNVMRMDEDEVEAVTQYVANGGRLYASGWTSLTHTSGERKRDFMLADVFGAHFSELESCADLFLKPTAPIVEQALRPQRYLSAITNLPSDRDKSTRDAYGVRLAHACSGDVLATLTLPYGAPSKGSVLDQDWSSIHSSPPWNDTNIPCVVHHRFGRGECIYASVPIESQSAYANTALLRALLQSLLTEPPSYHADTHPDVWMNVQRHEGGARYTIGFLNYQHHLPPIPIACVPFRMRLPQGTSPSRFVKLPEESPVGFDIRDGDLVAEARDLDLFQMYLLELA